MLCVKFLSYFLLSHISQRNFLLLGLDSEFSDVFVESSEVIRVQEVGIVFDAKRAVDLATGIYDILALEAMVMMERCASFEEQLVQALFVSEFPISLTHVAHNPVLLFLPNKVYSKILVSYLFLQALSALSEVSYVFSEHFIVCAKLLRSSAEQHFLAIFALLQNRVDWYQQTLFIRRAILSLLSRKGTKCLLSPRSLLFEIESCLVIYLNGCFLLIVFVFHDQIYSIS